MKHMKAILSLALVLSMALGLVMPTGVTNAADAPLTVTRVVEVGDGSIDVYFSEAIAPITSYCAMGICLIDQAETTIPVRGGSGSDANTLARYERNGADNIAVSDDGMKLNFNMNAVKSALTYARENLGARTTNSTYKIRFFIRDLATSTDGNAVIDTIVAKADSSKKLTANKVIDGKDHVLAEVEYSIPYVTGVDKINDTTYQFNFSEAVTVDAATRPTLAVVSKTTLAPVTRVVGSGSAQWIKTAGTFTVSQDGLSVTVVYDAAWITAAIKEYVAIGSDQCELQVRLLGNDKDSNCLLELITDADGNAAQAEFNNTGGGEAVLWNVSDMMCPKVTIGSVGYNAVPEALKAAISGNTVKLELDNDCAGETLVVPAGVTLDLNGNDLTAANVVSFGNVVDNAGGGALVMSNDRTEALLSLLPGNAMLPLYDASAGAYKFYTYTLENLGTKDATETSVKFGMRLCFTDTTAYDLLATGQVELGMQIQVMRGGSATNINFTFKDETVAAFAQAIQTSSTKAIVLTINGLESGDVLTVTPVMQTSAGVEAQTATSAQYSTAA